MTLSDKMKPSVILLVIFLLLLISASIYYYMYLPTFEHFETTTQPAPSVSQQPVPSVSSSTPSPSVSQQPTPSSSVNQQPYVSIPICKPPVDPSTNKSIMSRFFGIGFNIEYVNQNNNDYYLIKHIPTLSSGTLGGCYAITSDNLLTIKLKNNIDDYQL